MTSSHSTDFLAATSDIAREAGALLMDYFRQNVKIEYKGEADLVIKHGLDNCGIFHLKRPLLKNKKGNVITQDLNTLYYYHNRLVGYDLEKFI